MSALATFGITAVIVFILWSQYGMGAGLLSLCLAVVMFIGTMVMAEDGAADIADTTDSARR
jgi:hypothetical protein